ncbi:MAG: D-alanine--D-alanine ligase [Myxococcota bacterium]
MEPLRFGLVFDLLGTLPAHAGGPPDADVEYEPEETVALLEEAITRLGHQPVRLGNPHALLGALGKGEAPPVDVALSIAEGYGSRNREAWAPTLLEMAGIPFLGSDGLTLSTSLDKAWTHARVAAAGVPVPDPRVVSEADVEVVSNSAVYPLFVKPRWEGTAKGIGPASRVEDAAALRDQVTRIARDYAQPALVEGFVSGPEYTVTVVGHRPARALPVLQRALEDATRIGLHAVERHPAPGSGWQGVTPGSLDADLEALLARLAVQAFDALECLDFARADFRLDAQGDPVFLEINPLPTFAPDGSFGILAELEGRPAADLLADVFGEALVRLRLGS